jgi:MerR family mercuric resistance operon transcriptional regulator
MSRRTIGKLAKEAGVNIETIRFYERRGLLKRPQQPEEGWREYADTAVWAVCYIRQAQKLGFSLGEIKKLRMTFEDRGAFCRSLHDALAGKLRQTDEEIRRLAQLKEELERTLFGCLAMSDRGECPVAARYETRTGMKVKKTPVRGT